MEEVNRIKELKREHNCKSVEELVKLGVDIGNFPGIVFRSNINLDELTYLPEELPAIMAYNNNMSDVVAYLETHDMVSLSGRMRHINQRSKLIEFLLEYKRYDKVIYVLTKDHTFYGWEKKKKLSLKFKHTVTVYDKAIYDFLIKLKTPKCKDIILSLPLYIPYIGVLNNDNLEEVLVILITETNRDVLCMFRDEIISKNLTLPNVSFPVGVISYEFYYVFHKLLFEQNARFISIGHSSLIRRHIIANTEGISLESYAKIHNVSIYPNKHELMDGKSTRHKHPYLSYKYDKYSDNRELSITDLLEMLKHGKSLDDIVSNNYFRPSNEQLSKICDDDSIVGLIISVLQKQLVRLHLAKCENINCTIKQFSIVKTKRAI